MATINISLPDQMTHWIEAQAASERHSDVSEFVRDIVGREQERRDRIAATQCRVDEGRASGLSDETLAGIRHRAERQASGTR